MDSDDEPAERAAALEGSLRHSIAKIVRHAAPDRQASAGYIGALAGVVHQFAAKCVGRDLVAFRNHAGRRSVSEEDVLLLARRAPFREHLRRYLADDLGCPARGAAPARPRRAPPP
jgi:histone H3/H4